jgi:hypothetical protein
MMTLFILVIVCEAIKKQFVPDNKIDVSLQIQGVSIEILITDKILDELEQSLDF